MGGRGSGSGQRGKATTSGLAVLDVRRLQRDGLLISGNAFTVNWVGGGAVAGLYVTVGGAEQLMLEYQCSSGDDWQSMKYCITLEWTDCQFGGKRAWFLCPADGCRQRVALLHLGNSGIFACRSCYGLGYASQRMTTGDRAKARADKIRSKLGWQGSISQPKGDRPIGMHQRTFNKLSEAHDIFAAIAVDEAMRKFRRRQGLDAD